MVPIFRHQKSVRLPYFWTMPQDWFHTQLRSAREQAGLSQVELARRIGVSRTAIVALETGKTNLFSKHIPAIARALDLTEEELLLGTRPDVLLQDEQTRSEREHALIDEYERRIAALEEKLDAEKRLSKALQDNLDSLNRTHQYLLEQLRKEQ